MIIEWRKKYKAGKTSLLSHHFVLSVVCTLFRMYNSIEKGSSGKLCHEENSIVCFWVIFPLVYTLRFWREIHYCVESIRSSGKIKSSLVLGLDSGSYTQS